MRPTTALLAACSLLTLAACARAGDSYRAEGVNATVTPVREPGRMQDGPQQWMFRATLPGMNAASAGYTDFASPADLIAFVTGQPPQVRDNGLWVLVNDEIEPGPVVRGMLRDLVHLAGQEDVAVFLCRSSEFPHGYERVN